METVTATKMDAYAMAELMALFSGRRFNDCLSEAYAIADYARMDEMSLQEWVNARHRYYTYKAREC